MTINSTTRKTSVLVGNGNTATYPFAFKVFTDADVVVKKLEAATSIETTLTLGINDDYIVTLNDDQNSNPGGSITLKSGGNDQNLASGFSIVITSNVEPLQGTDLTNQGGFFPEVINDALDKAIVLNQQQQDELNRSIKFSLTNTIGSTEITQNAVARANKVFSFDNSGEFNLSDAAPTAFLVSGSAPSNPPVGSVWYDTVSGRTFVYYQDVDSVQWVDASPSFDATLTGALGNIVEDTSPQLGGNLDVQTNEITTSTSNGNIKLNPNGTGVVEIKGDGSSADGTIQLNCSQNSHGIKLKSPPHSAGASYTLTFPNTDGNANQVLKTDGSGGLDWVDQTTDTNTQLSNAEVRAAVEAATDSNVFTDADHTKLNGIEASATADQTASEIKTLLQSDKLTVNEIADDAITADKLANSINTEIAANTAKTSNATHTGEVTGSTALTIADNVVDEANLKVSNSPIDGYVLTAQSGNTGGLTWAAQSSGGGGATDKISEGNTEAETVDTGSDGHFKVTTEGAERFRIDSSGRVGIGTTSPNYLLDVEAASGIANARLSSVGTGSSDSTILRLQVGGSSASNYIYFGDTDDSNVGMIRYSHVSDLMQFHVNASEALRIDSSGRLLLGTTTEGHAGADNLTIADSGNVGITLRSGTTNNGAIFFSDATSGAAEYDGYVQYNHGADPFMQFGVGGGTKMAIKGSNVGIGTTSPAEKLDVNGEIQLSNFLKATGDLLLCADVDNNNSGTALRFCVDGDQSAEKMRIDENGKCGIGTTNPSYKLHVTASDFQVARFESTNANADGAYVELVANSSSPADNDILGILNFKGNNDASQLTTYGQIRTLATDVSDGSEDGDITFHTRAAGSFGERVRINSSGKVLIGSTTTSVASSFYDDLVISNTASGTGAGITLIANATDGFNAIDFSDTAASGRGRITYGHDVDRMMIHVGGAEAMRILSNGRVGIGTSSPSALLDVDGNVQFGDGGGFDMNINGTRHQFSIGGSEKMRIDNNGRVKIGTSSRVSAANDEIFASDAGTSGGYGGVFASNTTGGFASIYLKTGDNVSNLAIFTRNDTVVGSITTNGTTTTYNTTSSDRARKKNFEAWTENTLNLFKNINPQKFNFIQQDDGTEKTKGFVAQDLVDSFPEAYSKDPDDKYMFNPSGMVIYLMKAIQELEAKVEALETA